MIDLLRSIWTSRDRTPLLRAVIVFAAGAFSGGLVVAGILW